MKGWKETAWRAARTFVQAALSYIMTALGGGIAGLYDAEGNISRVAVGGVVVSALAAGLAALMNLPEKKPTVKETQSAEIVKRYVETIDDLPTAGQNEPKSEGDDE